VTIAPDIAIEIASPGQSVKKLLRRCRWYVSNGVEIVLLVDPADRSVRAFLPTGAVQEWHGADPIDISPIVPDLDLTVEQLFQSLQLGSGAAEPVG
jgi:Uma2 family endonuclease